jgi:hypothetical protein
MDSLEAVSKLPIWQINPSVFRGFCPDQGVLKRLLTQSRRPCRVDPMSQAPTPDNQANLDRLLTSLAFRLDGALDFWTVVGLMRDDLMAVRRGFLEKQAAGMRTASGDVETLTAQTGRAADETIRRCLDTLVTGCGNLLNAFLDLLQVRALPLSELRTSVDKVIDTWSVMHRALRQLGRRFGVEARYWREPQPEHQAYVQRIAGGLFDTIRLTLAAEHQASASATGSAVT